MKIIVTCKYGMFESENVPHSDEEREMCFKIAETAAKGDLGYLEIDAGNGKHYFFPSEILKDSVITIEE